MTEILGIVGHPLGHSVSVPMQMSAIFKLGMDYVYMSFDIMPQDLSFAVQQFKHEGLKGFNVTIPYKEAIIPYLDDMDVKAHQIGAVNTVNREDGKLKGYNTDWLGYIHSLKQELDFNPSGKRAIIIGAGGASKAVAFALLESGINFLLIVNRSIARAESLSKHLGTYFKASDIRVLPLDRINEVSNNRYDLIVNTTSVGMKESGSINIDFSRLKKDVIVSDIVYNPIETPFLKSAKQYGLKTHNGTGMLLYQGMESFRIWTGITPPIDVMREAMLNALKEHELL
ncbi:MAG: shikimate dehydrogenase [Deltaproteobacteria bacterium]|nr:shikimate dehydrogenase [Deltaproteobacteria bacterium]MCL5791664.1 shikimate dehydrogenase [Deltaproteobacteria bacterium]